MRIPFLLEKVEERRGTQKKGQYDYSEKEQPSHFLYQVVTLVDHSEG